eukprot:TRINITY_DN3157_c0_g1_i1.p1 TRINITY_DN3157_c0_g1~~TRINITY_DN3157_c0_g1_i1.p1  ORF type:complete len:197 (-),score=47.23 TRINITY_DN3157_c0_g1_i1:12-602(-)
METVLPSDVTFFGLFDQKKEVSWEYFVNFMKEKYKVPENILDPFKSTLLENVMNWDTEQTEKVVTFERVFLLNEYFGQISTEEGHPKWCIYRIASLFAKDWFEAYLSGTAAQLFIKNKGPGSFVIHFSTNTPGSLAITIKHANGNEYHHFLIRITGNPKNIYEVEIAGRLFEDIEALVETYAHEAIPGASCPLSLQ